MVGDGRSTSFFTVDRTGLIKLKPEADLTKDTAVLYFVSLHFFLILINIFSLY